MDRQRKADMMLVLATGFWGISNCLIAICLRDMQPVTLNAFRFLSAFVVLGAVFHKRVLRASRETWRYSVLVGLSARPTAFCIPAYPTRASSAR